MHGKFEKVKYDLTIEQTLEGEKEYFNNKFLAVGSWLSVDIREAQRGSGESGNARRFELVVRTEAGPNSEIPQSELFVCYYDEGDPDRRERAERLLNAIYPTFSRRKGEV